MGARVIKIERPGAGDLGRALYISGGDAHGKNTLFQAINRNKESYAANLKGPQDLDELRKLIARADVMVQNFRPGVMERLGLGYERVSRINPKLIYAAVTGYGTADAWRDRPGKFMPFFSVLMFPCESSYRTIRANSIAAIGLSLALLVRLITAIH